MKVQYFLILLLLGISCQQVPEKKPITNIDDYDKYLSTNNSPSLFEIKQQNVYWSNRLSKDTSGVGDIGPLAATYESLFEQTGKIEHLKSAEKLYRKGIQIAAPQFKDGLERGLAHVLISQHRFKEAYEILTTSYEGLSSKQPTKLMLFDVAMELGYYDEAYQWLTEIKDLSDYNYLIRLSKWSDYKGDLDSAIKYMEMAKEKAEARDSKSLKVWTYSNLGDYYGHAGRIEDAYKMYVKTLTFEPDNAYAKKGIAYIVYAAEKKTEEALRILDSIIKQHQAPDYHLLKSDIYTYQGKLDQAKSEIDLFLQKVAAPEYGQMYNTYLIEILSEQKPSAALKIAQEEIDNRATPETYDWLAYAYLKAGDKNRALQVMKEKVEGKTHEPIALLHAAMIYKANGNTEKLSELNRDLLEARFELGPVLMKEVEAL